MNLINRQALTERKFPEVECNGLGEGPAYRQGWNDAIDAIIDNEPSTQPERKTGHLSNKDWVDLLTEQFNVSRTSAKEMLHAMMSVKKEDNFKKQFNGMGKD